MLILTRKIGESVIIDGSIEVEILGIRNDSVRLGILAPEHIVIDRREIHERKNDPNLNHHNDIRSEENEKVSL